MRSATRIVPIFLSITALAAAEVPVEVVDRGGARLVLDGVIREWGADFVELGDESALVRGAAGWRGPDDARLRFALASDASSLWVAVDVTDDRLVRSLARRANEDAVIITLSADGTTRELALHPGLPGRFASEVRLSGPRAAALPGAEAVEAATPQGFSMEARVPWSALGGIGPALDRVRIRVAYRDGDGSGPVSELASGPGDAAHPEALPFSVNARRAGAGAPQRDPLDAFRAARGLQGASASFERRVDLGGDARPERLVVVGQNLVVTGPTINGYLFAELIARAPGDLLDVEVRDVTGDRRAEVLVRERVALGGGAREVLSVFALRGEALRRVFAQELARTSGAQRLSASVTWQDGGAATVAFARNEGWSAASWAEVRDDTVRPSPTPWGPHRAVRYRWREDAGEFVQEQVVPNAAVQAAVAQPTAPTAPGDAADVAGVLTLFRQREGIAPGARPTHAARADVVGDATPEQVLVFGRVMVLVGPRFMGGRSYYAMQLPIREHDDVRSLQLVDLTGDARAEAVVRVRRNVTTRIRGAEVPSQRELLLVYSFDPARRGRIFAVEVARRVGDDAIENEVSMPSRPGGALSIRAGRVRGWTEANYPFHDVPQEGVAPLLLPWGAGAQRVEYRWDGTSLSRSR